MLLLSYTHASNGSKSCFLAKLIVGEVTDIAPDGRLTMPPQKPGESVRFDTVSGTTGGSKVYIVYANGRAYPEYLVTYNPYNKCANEN